MYVTSTNMSKPIAPIYRIDFNGRGKLTFNCLSALPKWILMTYRVFFPYLLSFSLVVSGMPASACGVT